jgi:DNA-binding MarR family transcriptional regulator
VDSGQLHRLGRRLIELARAGTSDDSDRVLTPVEVAIVDDVIRNPGASVTDIGQRTGFVQSHVSASVARLRERGIVETAPDPADRRRTTVRIARPAMRAIVHRSRRPVDGVVKAAVPDTDTARRVIELLDELAELLGTA